MSDLVNTLVALQGVSEEDILASDNAHPADEITVADPPRELLYRVEPDFIVGYDIDPEALWEAYVRGEPILIVGPHGTGKSSLAFHLLDNANEPVRKKNREIYEKNLKLIKKGGGEDALIPYKDIPYPTAYLGCGAGTRTEQTIGTLKFRATEHGREPYTVYGAVVDAWVNGKTLIMDEIMSVVADQYSELHQFFDSRTETTTIYINGPEVIKKHPRFRVIATDNDWGYGENQLEYANTQLQSTAFLGRFTYKVELNYLKPDKEVHALMTKLPASYPDAIRKMVEVANKIRDAKKAGVLTQTLSTRQLLAWARECLACGKRKGVTFADFRNYWQNVVIPSAGPTFLTGNPDRDVLKTYLEIK